MEVTFRTLVSVLLFCQYLSDPIAGPYNAIMHKVTECPKELLEPGFPFHSRVYRDRFNTLRFYLSANFTLLLPFDDETDGRIEFASWSSRGGWKENAVTMKFHKTCTALHTLAAKSTDFLVRHALFNSKNISPGTCPWAPDTYEIRNISLNGFRPIPTMFYGKWRADAIAVNGKHNMPVFCVRVFADVVPKIRPPKRPS